MENLYKKLIGNLGGWVVALTLGLIVNTAFSTPPAGIYWTDGTTRTINRANLDGTGRTLLLNTGSSSVPRDIHIDTQNEGAYWSQWNSDMIKHAELDEAGSSTIVYSIGLGCSGFDIDYGNGLIFWVEKTGGEFDSIRRADLTGDNESTLIQFTGGGAVDLVLDTNGGKMYWTLSGADGYFIQSANLDGTNMQTLCATGRNPFDLELDLAGGKMYWTEYNGYDPGSVCRANLNGSGKETLVSGLVDPFGLALDIPSGQMYWTDNGTGKIQKANFDGTQVQDVITGLSEPWGIDIVSVPEPTMLALLTLGGIMLRKRR